MLGEDPWIDFFCKAFLRFLAHVDCSWGLVLRCGFPCGRVVLSSCCPCYRFSYAWKGRERWFKIPHPPAKEFAVKDSFSHSSLALTHLRRNGRCEGVTAFTGARFLPGEDAECLSDLLLCTCDSPAQTVFQSRARKAKGIKLSLPRKTKVNLHAKWRPYNVFWYAVQSLLGLVTLALSLSSS